MLKYKGYAGTVEYDSEENTLFGKVINANAVIMSVLYSEYSGVVIRSALSNS